MTVNDYRGIDNRISVFTPPTGRLALTAPEGLGDPDGSGSACSLDNAKPGESTAQEVSCVPGYIGAIVGDLGGGNDTFDADPSLPVTDRRRDRRPGSGRWKGVRAGTAWWAARWPTCSRATRDRTRWRAAAVGTV